MGKLKLSVLTPEVRFYEGEADAVNFTCADGGYEILPGHAPICLCLVTGKLEVKTEGAWETLWVTDGLAKVNEDQVLVFVRRGAHAQQDLLFDEQQHAARMRRLAESIQQHEEGRLDIVRALADSRKKRNRNV